MLLQQNRSEFIYSDNNNRNLLSSACLVGTRVSTYTLAAVTNTP